MSGRAWQAAGASAQHSLRIDYAERNIAQRFLAGEGALSFR